MSTVIHFVDVGQGNMTLIQCSNGDYFIVDCNITEENEDSVLGYVAEQFGWGAYITAFICSHRDADHMRGVKKLDKYFNIDQIWDSGYPGTTTDCTEYKEYMELRRSKTAIVKKKQTKQDFGRTRFRYLSAQDSRLASNANAQGIVLKIEHRSADLSVKRGSAMISGDSDAETWRYAILKDYSKSDLECDILLGGHHGSITFFDDPADEKNYYTDHVKAMSPDMSIISVGDNPHGHPDKKALELYEKYSAGSDKGNKVFRTDVKGDMKLTLKDEGGWNLKVGRKL